MTFGEKVRMYRLQRGMTMEELSRLTELSVSAISMYETNRRPTPLPVAKAALAKVFRVKPEELDDDKEDSVSE